MLLASKKSVMGNLTSGFKTTWFGWGGVVVMGFAVLMMFWDLLRQALGYRLLSQQASPVLGRPFFRG